MLAKVLPLVASVSLGGAASGDEPPDGAFVPAADMSFARYP